MQFAITQDGETRVKEASSWLNKDAAGLVVGVNEFKKKSFDTNYLLNSLSANLTTFIFPNQLPKWPAGLPMDCLFLSVVVSSSGSSRNFRHTQNVSPVFKIWVGLKWALGFWLWRAPFGDSKHLSAIRLPGRNIWLLEKLASWILVLQFPILFGIRMLSVPLHPSFHFLFHFRFIATVKSQKLQVPTVWLKKVWAFRSGLDCLEIHKFRSGKRV